jgi:hypothetical protein
MSGEVSYFSRFFVKFVEIIAAGVASAVTAYLLAHFGGLLSSPTPVSAPATPTASEIIAKPSAPAAVTEHAAPAQDAPEAKLAPKAEKDPKVAPPRKHTKSDTSVVEKEPRNHKSAETLVRDALTKFDANRRVLPDMPDRTEAPSGQVDNAPPRQANVPLQQGDVGPRPDVPASRGSEMAPNAASIPLPPVQPAPVPGADPRTRPLDARTAPPSASSPEVAVPHPLPAAEENKAAFSPRKRVPDMERPEPPAAIGDPEPPRPPMPVGAPAQ